MPPRRRPHHPRAPMVCCLALTSLVACGGASGEEVTNPLDAAFPVPSPAEQRAQSLRYEEAIARCMEESGWTYTPTDSTIGSVNVSEADDPSTNPDYGARYGYGVAHNYELYELPFIDADGNYLDADIDQNPNDAYLQTLSDADETDYLAALYGVEPSSVSIDDEGVYVEDDRGWEQRGCTGRAEHEVFADTPFDDQTFSDRYFALHDELVDDPAIAVAEGMWSDCMYELDERYDFTATIDAHTYAEQLLYLAKGLRPGDVDPSTGELLDRKEDGISVVFHDGTWFGFTGTEHRLTETELEDLTASEVAVWEDDQHCRDESGLADLMREREQAIADTLVEEFPQYAAGGGEDES